MNRTNAEELRYGYRYTGKYEGMGAVRMKGGTAFFAEVQPHVAASLIVYEKGSREVLEEIPFPEERLIGNVAALNVPWFLPGKHEYNFRIEGVVRQDPYAKVLCGEREFGARITEEHAVRCAVSDGRYDWGGDKNPRIPYEECVMYSLHVRGFTKQKNSGVRHKGTFLGLAEKAEYLKELGINQVKLMPAYDFAERGWEPVRGGALGAEIYSERLNYWGYTGGCCFAPKRAYAATRDPVREFKDMVKKLHGLGIEVLMEFCFGEHTGPRYVFDCLQYWMQEYHVDGFHLIGNQNLCNLAARDPLFAGVKLLNVYFPTEEIYGRRKEPGYRTLAQYNDGFMTTARRFLKGEENCLLDIVQNMRKNSPTCGTVNYIADHDGFTLNDMVSYEERHNEENGENNCDGRAQNFSWNCGEEGETRKKKILDLRRRQMRNALCIVFLSAGTPMLFAGDEFENSQNGNNNPYCLDSDVSWTDWKAYRSGKNELFRFVKRLIAFRRKHKILHMPGEFAMADTLSCGFPDLSYHGKRAWYGDFDMPGRQIGMLYCGAYAGMDEFLYVACNMHWMEHEFAVPHIPDGYEWRVAVDTAVGIYDEGEQPLLDIAKYVQVAPRTIMVFVGRKP